MKIQFAMVTGLVAAACTLSLVSRPANAESFDAVTDFSATNNPSGPWTYGYITDGSLNTNKFSKFTYESGNDWRISNPQSDPNIYDSGTALILGPYQGPAVVQWTAPNSGLIDITSYGANDQVCCGPGDAERATNYVVVVNNNFVTPAFSQKLSTLGSSAPYDATLFVTQGETIDFIAYNGGEGDNNSLTFDATIGFVPEPSSIVALCGLGTVVLLLAVRRRRRGK